MLSIHFPSLCIFSIVVLINLTACGGGRKLPDSRPVDTAKPFVFKTFPVAESVMNTGESIIITFNEPIRPVTTDRVSITPIINGLLSNTQVLIKPSELILTEQDTVLKIQIPNTLLHASTIYFVRIQKIQDYAGNEMAETCVWKFSTNIKLVNDGNSSICDTPLPTPGTFEFSVTSSKTFESNGSTNLTVTRKNGSGGDVTLNYATSDKSAKAGIDYTAIANGTLSFTNGELNKTISLELLNDQVMNQADKTFNVTLSLPTTSTTGAIINNNKANHVVTIIDNDILTLNYYVKQLKFSWPKVPGTQFYRLLENTNGNGFVQVGDNIIGLSKNIDITVHDYDWTNSRYILEACTSNTNCTNSNIVSSLDQAVKTIGYFKPSNTAGGMTFGTTLSLSTDGNTLAVGAYTEGSNATGVNGAISGFTPGSGAVYIFTRTIDGLWTEQAFIKASNTGKSDYFGSTVVLSDDGNTLAVSATAEASTRTGVINDNTKFPIPDLNDDAAPNAGAVYLFTRTAGSWLQQAYIKASNTNKGHFFGRALTLSNNGDTLAIGADHESTNTTNVINDPTLFPTPAPNDPTSLYSGAVYVYSRANSIWSEQSYIKGSNTGSGDFFGFSVSISNDGNTLAVGAFNEDSNNTGVINDSALFPIADPADFGALNSGAVYLFTRTNSNWSQRSYIKASNPSNSDEFGIPVMLSGDGKTLAVAARKEDSLSTSIINGSTLLPKPIPQANEDLTINAGAAYVFKLTGSVWSQHSYIKATNAGVADQFAHSLALSSDGNTLVLGSFREDSDSAGINGPQNDLAAGTDSGAMYVYKFVNSNWLNHAFIKAKNPQKDDWFAESVTLSQDGKTLAAGARSEDSKTTGINSIPNESGTNAGAVYIY